MTEDMSPTARAQDHDLLPHSADPEVPAAATSEGASRSLGATLRRLEKRPATELASTLIEAGEEPSPVMTGEAQPADAPGEGAWIASKVRTLPTEPPEEREAARSAWVASKVRDVPAVRQALAALDGFRASLDPLGRSTVVAAAAASGGVPQTGQATRRRIARTRSPRRRRPSRSPKRRARRSPPLARPCVRLRTGRKRQRCRRPR